MLAALKFFLGQDEAEAADSDDEDEPDAPKLVNPSKAEVYKATKKVGGPKGVGSIPTSALSVASAASQLPQAAPASDDSRSDSLGGHRRVHGPRSSSQC